MNKIIVRLSALLIVIASSASNAWAIAAPTDTSAFLYPVYDIVVVKLGSGPAMFAMGFIGICFAGYYLWNTKIGPALGVLVGTGIIVAAALIVPTLGLTF